MEQTGYQQLMASSQNLLSQSQPSKRPMPTKAEEQFGGMTSKKDLYDHQKNILQVSLIFKLTNLL